MIVEASSNINGHTANNISLRDYTLEVSSTSDPYYKKQSKEKIS